MFLRYKVRLYDNDCILYDKLTLTREDLIKYLLLFGVLAIRSTPCKSTVLTIFFWVLLPYGHLQAADCRSYVIDSLNAFEKRKSFNASEESLLLLRVNRRLRYRRWFFWDVIRSEDRLVSSPPRDSRRQVITSSRVGHQNARYQSYSAVVLNNTLEAWLIPAFGPAGQIIYAFFHRQVWFLSEDIAARPLPAGNGSPSWRDMSCDRLGEDSPNRDSGVL